MEKITEIQKYATRGIFFISGFAAASWAPLVPVLRERLNIGEDILGMLLLCMGAGAFMMMPIAGSLSARIGCRKFLTGASLIMVALLLALCKLSTIQTVIPTIIIFGAIMGGIDVVMNIQAIIVEKALKKRIMSGTHALWSIGGFIGAGLFGVWVGILGLTPFQSTLIAVVIILIILAKCSKYLLSYGGEKSSQLIAIPRGIVIFIGVVSLISFLVEGAIMDWSGVFLTVTKGFDISKAGAGFATFSAAMVLMRILGDGLVQALGQKLIVLGGCLISFSGFMLLIFSETQFLMYGGFFLIGIGSANIVPVFYSLLGKQKVMPVNMAVPAMSTLGYLGGLMGPATIGFVAHLTSLYISFGMLAALIILQIFLASYVYRQI